MRQYFSKAVLVGHPLIDEMCDELGNDAYRFLTILTDLWQEIGEFEITAKLLKQRCRINAQKSERIIERFSKYFQESLKILKLVEESSEILNNLEESSGKLNKVEESSTLDGENTDGRNKSITRKDKDKDINNIKTKKEKSSLTPEVFEINEILQQWLDSKNYPRAWAEYEIEGFLDHHRNKQSKFTDWNGAFRTWCKNGESYGSLKRWQDRNGQVSGAHGKPACPSPSDPEYDKKMATYLASIPVGFAEYKNRGN